MAKDTMFELWQGGIVVASVIAPTWHDALREISHYAAQYEQDGPVEIRKADPDKLELEE